MLRSGEQTYHPEDGGPPSTYMGSKQVCAWSPAWDLLFSSFYRTTWCISLGMLAWAALAGQAGPIAAVLGSSFWTPIARLTFGVYLCHIMVVRLLYYSVAKPFDCKATHRVILLLCTFAAVLTAKALLADEDYTGAAIFTSNYTLSLLSSFGVYVLVEKPFANLVMMLVGGAMGQRK